MGIPAEKISILSTYNGQKAFVLLCVLYTVQSTIFLLHFPSICIFISWLTYCQLGVLWSYGLWLFFVFKKILSQTKHGTALLWIACM